MIRALAITGALTLLYLTACVAFEAYNAIEGRALARKAGA